MNGSYTPLKEPISILMPVCNERDVLVDVLGEWEREVVSRLPEGSQVVIDDCSDDGTYEIILSLAQTRPWLKVIRSKKEGFFRAAKRLYESAETPWVFFTDSDGQYVPSEFWKLVPLMQSNDIVHGAKRNRKDPFYRVIASQVFNTIASTLFGTRHRDINSAFRLVRREVIEAVVPKVHVMKTLFNAELLLRAEAMGFRVASIDVCHRYRKVGKSRGLPLGSFLTECRTAYQGLKRLRNELSGLKKKSAPFVPQVSRLELNNEV